MFVIGETREKVSLSKLVLPKEYKLGRKNRKIYGIWVGNKILHLSDDMNSLKVKAGKNSIAFELHIDNGNKINIPKHLDKTEAIIKGCISTIKIEFVGKGE